MVKSATITPIEKLEMFGMRQMIIWLGSVRLRLNFKIQPRYVYMRGYIQQTKEIMLSYDNYLFLFEVHL
jgi:hypothetical protein